MPILVKIKNISGNPLPHYQTPESAGVDLTASIEAPIILKPMQRALIATGLFLELPSGYEAQIRPRSGLALKHGITVLNSPGTIDADYRGEIKILLINFGSQDFEVNSGDRIAQMIICNHETATWVAVSELAESVRGTGGYGSTGV
ncbi:MAG: dUTP diphosphatase [Bacteroidetes bacterium]|nr:dUTP diphosphatase [Bacteroidota bacterium]